MTLLKTLAVAFSMYSALPTPRVAWSEKNLRYALAAFPLVGAVVGLAWRGVDALGLPPLLRGALLCIAPTILTGGVHLDGYADVADALASRAEAERKREILRDPHIGAFAVIRLCVYFIAYFALCCAAPPAGAVLWSFPLSRALSGLALVTLPIAEGSSLARTFADAADKRRVRALLAAETLLCAAAMVWRGGWAMLVAAAAASARYVYAARRQFGGTSGDLAGWFLVKAEFWMLAAHYAEGWL